MSSRAGWAIRISLHSAYGALGLAGAMPLAAYNQSHRMDVAPAVSH
jgi:hypothetical protein